MEAIPFELGNDITYATVEIIPRSAPTLRLDAGSGRQIESLCEHRSVNFAEESGCKSQQWMIAPVPGQPLCTNGAITAILVSALDTKYCLDGRWNHTMLTTPNQFVADPEPHQRWVIGLGSAGFYSIRELGGNFISCSANKEISIVPGTGNLEEQFMFQVVPHTTTALSGFLFGEPESNSALKGIGLKVSHQNVTPSSRTVVGEALSGAHVPTMTAACLGTAICPKQLQMGNTFLAGWKSSQFIISGKETQLKTVPFPSPFEILPKVDVSIAGFDAAPSRALKLKLAVTDVSLTDFTVAASSWDEGEAFAVDVSWIATALHPADAQLGSALVLDEAGGTEKPSVLDIKFATAFSTPPALVLSLKTIGATGSGVLGVDLKAMNVSVTGFQLHAVPREGAQMTRIEATWFASVSAPTFLNATAVVLQPQTTAAGNNSDDGTKKSAMLAVPFRIKTAPSPPTSPVPQQQWQPPPPVHLPQYSVAAVPAQLRAGPPPALLLTNHLMERFELCPRQKRHLRLAHNSNFELPTSGPQQVWFFQRHGHGSTTYSVFQNAGEKVPKFTVEIIPVGHWLRFKMSGSGSDYLTCPAKEKSSLVTSPSLDDTTLWRLIPLDETQFTKTQLEGYVTDAPVASATLGNGCWGCASRVVHLLDGNRYAVKRFNRPFESLRRELTRELSALTAIPPHRNLLRYNFSAIKNGTLFVVSSFVEGVTIQHIKKTYPNGINQRQAIAWTTQLFSAVAHLHTSVPPLQHRDLHSQNVMIDVDEQVVVLDFGNAKLKERPGAAAEEDVGGIVATFSPERRTTKRYNEKDDVWSAALLIVELVSGKPTTQWPNSGKNGDDLSTSPGVLEEMVQCVIRLHAGLGEVIGWVLRARDPNTRPTAMDVWKRASELRE